MLVRGTGSSGSVAILLVSTEKVRSGASGKAVLVDEAQDGAADSLGGRALFKLRDVNCPRPRSIKTSPSREVVERRKEIAVIPTLSTRLCACAVDKLGSVLVKKHASSHEIASPRCQELASKRRSRESTDCPPTEAQSSKSDACYRPLSRPTWFHITQAEIMTLFGVGVVATFCCLTSNICRRTQDRACAFNVPVITGTRSHTPSGNTSPRTSICRTTWCVADRDRRLGCWERLVRAAWPGLRSCSRDFTPQSSWGIFTRNGHSQTTGRSAAHVKTYPEPRRS